MKVLVLLLVMLAACDATPQDLSGKMFTFPQETSTDNVKLTMPTQDFSALTVCHRSFTDLKRDHALFSMSTSIHSNSFLIFWDSTNKEVEPHVMDMKTEFWGLDYKPNTWHSICTTWDSSSGLVQLWFDGLPSIRKYSVSRANITGSMVTVLGQEQDSHGAGFNLKQSFVGMMSDVHMWDHVLTPCEIQRYMDHQNFTPGNVLNWRSLEFRIRGRVLIEDKKTSCY